ncbi:MAG: DUF3035 domain-containing protein [Paracoccaceae bacterium]|nr:MAG: DUF3035 domain-containing protein [Paracoccaceae bacterium]
MRAGRFGLGLAGGAVMLLAACDGGEPRLMNLRSTTSGPDEFAILPPKPLSLPPSFAELPEPAPGGTNLTDPNPTDDAIAALGGRPGAGVGGDAGLMSHAGRYGRSAGIRDQLAAEDLEFRGRNRGRPLERLFGLNVYIRAYQPQALDQDAELARWRRAGVRTPSAPPETAR